MSWLGRGSRNDGEEWSTRPSVAEEVKDTTCELRTYDPNRPVGEAVALKRSDKITFTHDVLMVRLIVADRERLIPEYPVD